MTTEQSVASGTLPERDVRAMFDRIAKRYDSMNSLMTAGLHREWRVRAADLAGLAPGGRVLDLATGTGDFAFELAKRVAPGGTVVGADFSEGMLEIARTKHSALMQRISAAVTFETANAMELPYESASFDAATVGFGARNFSDLDRGLAEMVRVVKAGGKIVILEISQPTDGPMGAMLRLWFDRFVPLLGKLGAEGAAYSYLPNSVKRWVSPTELVARLSAAGTDDAKYVSLAGGLITIHHAIVKRSS